MAKRQKDQGMQEEDAFVRGVLRAANWVQRNSRTVTVAAVIALLGVAGLLYYRSYREGLREEASAEFQRLQSAVAGSPPDTLAAHLQGFVDRYGGTEYARNARMLLARIWLANGRWDETIEILEPLPRDPSTPTGYAVGKLLAAAHEGAGRREEALGHLERLARNARFDFQRRAAEADRASILVGQGRLEEAAAIYERLAAETPEDAPDAGEYAPRLGEVRAALRSGSEIPALRPPGRGADSVTRSPPEGGSRGSPASTDTTPAAGPRS